MNYGPKKSFVQCGAFIGIVCAFFLVLSLFIVLSRGNWERGLRRAVQSVLPSSEYSVGKMLRLEEGGGNFACFEISRNSDGTLREFSERLAIVMRVTTYYGPLPAVFIREGGETRFVGIAYLSSSVTEEFSDADRSRSMDFWIGQADEIFDAAARLRGI
ncbi:MAG: hypothetical protein K2I95_00400 [Treponemataceae bacterium]|nr:hypothetical protein [Treponemataceae bacterium]